MGLGVALGAALATVLALTGQLAPNHLPLLPLKGLRWFPPEHLTAL